MTKEERLAKRRGKALADVRQKMGHTQEAMARLMRVHRATLVQWETAARPMPEHRLDQLAALITKHRHALTRGVTMTATLRVIEEVR